MKIWVHTIVKNEERYIWYAVGSVIDHIDKILIWDTGSRDKTVKIIDKLKNKYPLKVWSRQVNQRDVNHFTQIRQEMLNETKSDWILILDGDEVWWDAAIKNVVEVIRRQGENLDSIVSRYVNIVGDVYHYQEEAAGKYEIDGRKGHITIRAMNRGIPGLHVSKPHGQQGFYDNNGGLIQNRSPQKRVFMEKLAYMHFTNMGRSSSADIDNQVAKRKKKFKYEIGNEFPLDFYYPEVFFRPRPNIVPSIWEKYSTDFFVKSLLTTYPRKIKRRLITSKTGY